MAWEAGEEDQDMKEAFCFDGQTGVYTDSREELAGNGVMDLGFGSLGHNAMEMNLGRDSSIGTPK